MRDALYTTREGDRLDQVVRAHYGALRPGALESVLEANPHAALYDVLPAGVVIALPAALQGRAAADVVRLW